MGSEMCIRDRLSSFAADDLTEIVVTYNGETNTLRSADGGWTLAEDPAYHLDETSCNTMRTALAALNAKRQLTEEPGEDYGFTADSLTVTVTAAGETNTFTFIRWPAQRHPASRYEKRTSSEHSIRRG